MENDNKLVCMCCGVEITDDMWYEKDARGDILCNDCREHYIVCEDCGEFCHEDSMIYIDSEEKCVCESCFDSDYITCADCGATINCTDSYSVINRYNDEVEVCHDCRDDHYNICDNCDNIVHESLMHWYDDYCYCEECDNSRNDDRVWSYHEHSRDEKSVKHYCEGENEDSMFFGIETETEYMGSDNRPKMNEYLDELDMNFLPCVYERDGSLDDTGIEVITKPCTWNYIMERVDNIKRAFENSIALGYGGDNSRCGIHIHVSRPKSDVIDKIILVMETFKNEIIKIARRHNTHYSFFLSDDKGCKVDSLKYIEKNKSYSHCSALNLEHENTIEFRIFRSTLNYKTWLAYLEFVKNLVTLCSDESIELSEITWDKLITGEFIRPYAEQREVVNCNKVVVDDSQKYIIIENKISAVHKKILRIVRVNYINELEDRLKSIKITKTLRNKDIMYNMENLRSMKTSSDILLNMISTLENAKYYLDKGSYSQYMSYIDDLISLLKWNFGYDKTEFVTKIQALYEVDLRELVNQYNTIG